MSNETIIECTVGEHTAAFVRRHFPELIWVEPAHCSGFKIETQAFEGWCTHVAVLDYDWLTGYGIASFLYDPAIPEDFFACGIQGAMDEKVFALCRDKDRRFFFRDKFLCLPAIESASKELAHSTSVSAVGRWNAGERYVVYTPDGPMSPEKIARLLAYISPPLGLHELYWRDPGCGCASMDNEEGPPYTLNLACHVHGLKSIEIKLNRIKAEVLAEQQKQSATNITTDRRKPIQRLIVAKIADGCQYSFSLLNETTNIGRGKHADIQTGGFLAPRLSALIHRRKSHWLIPRRRGQVKLNGRVITRPQVLQHLDVIEIRRRIIICCIAVM